MGLDNHDHAYSLESNIVSPVLLSLDTLQVQNLQSLERHVLHRLSKYRNSLGQETSDGPSPVRPSETTIPADPPDSPAMDPNKPSYKGKGSSRGSSDPKGKGYDPNVLDGVLPRVETRGQSSRHSKKRDDKKSGGGGSKKSVTAGSSSTRGHEGDTDLVTVEEKREAARAPRTSQSGDDVPPEEEAKDVGWSDVSGFFDIPDPDPDPGPGLRPEPQQPEPRSAEAGVEDDAEHSTHQSQRGKRDAGRRGPRR